MADRKLLYRLTLAMFVLSALGVSALAFTSWGEYMEEHVGRRALFYTRTYLGMDPPLDPRLKIYALDDQTIEHVKSHDLSLKGWSDFFLYLSPRKPRAIIIDKVFGYPLGKEYAQGFKDDLYGSAPIYVGSYFSPHEIPLRENLAPLFVNDGMGKYFQDKTDYELFFRDALPFVHVYGPNADIRAAFAGLGHLVHAGNATTYPLVPVHGGGVIPHISLFAANEVVVRDGGLYVDGKLAAANGARPVVANLADPSVYHRRTTSIAYLTSHEGAKKSLANIEVGDVVLVLPLMYTGNVDWKDTPVGRLQGGYMLAAVINSVLTGNWLRSFDNIPVFVSIAAALGCAYGLLFSLSAFWAVFGSTLVFFGLASFYLFAFESTLIPWIHTYMAFALPAIVLFERRSSLKKEQAAMLRDALEGVIPTSKVNELLQNPNPFRTDASEQILTVMFIDIVGFSRASEQLTPKEAFENLRHYFDSLIEIIHRHDGAVDKLLGDGILCYFGYRFKDMPPILDHPDKALACAIEIQRTNVQRCINAQKQGEPVFPVRIGINTATVYFGDLGGSRRVEFTCIGSGVNLAHRLESSCDPFRIMIGIASMDLMKPVNKDSDQVKRKIVQIKHQFEPIEAYEYEVFPEDDATFLDAFNAYRSFSNLQRLENRWPIPGAGSVQAKTNYGDGLIVDFSRSGFGLMLDTYLGKGVNLNLDLYSDHKPLQDYLNKLGKLPIVAEVRWSRRHEHGFLHGVLVKNLHDDQRQQLIEILREALIFNQRQQAS